MGMAKLKQSGRTVTQVDDGVGTPYYCAPESYNRKACVASDVWSLGLVLAEIFGRRHAWGRLMTQGEMMGLMMSQSLPPLGHLCMGIKSICKMCVIYDHKERASIVDVLRSLRICDSARH